MATVLDTSGTHGIIKRERSHPGGVTSPKGPPMTNRSGSTNPAALARTDRIRSAFYVVLGAAGLAGLAGAIATGSALAIAGIVSLIVLVALLWRQALRNPERTAQQEMLEQQAVQLEEQAAELEMQIVSLEESNRALREAETAKAAEHRRMLDEMAQRIRQSKLLEAAMATVPIGIAIIDRNMRYIKVNHAIAAVTGIPVEAHTGRGVKEVNPRLLPEVEAATKRVLETGEPCLNLRVSRPTPHAAGGSLELVLQITAFRDETGAIAGICNALTDVTDWKTMQDKVFRVQKLEAVGQLAASVAHDFNNLLTIVASCCDLMLLEMPDSAAHRPDVEEIRSAADRATTLARRMLGMAHQHAFVPKPVELSHVVREASDLLKRATGKKVRLVVQCAEDAGVVQADPSQLEQLLLNLAINAVDAMPDGGTLTVETRGVSLETPLAMRSGTLMPGEYSELIVRDTGTGMPDETLARIFEPFFTTKPSGKGTGLGLATVFAIVRDLNGGVSVDSAAEEGTSFRLLFPRLTDEETTGPRRARAEAAAGLPRGTETLLVVEDEDALRSSVARVFARQGFNVLEARHGGEALRVLANHDEVALIVSDLHMPGVGGRELSTRMRALGRELPVLFMSGTSDAGRGDAAQADLLQGRDRFIAKPFEVEELLSTVRAMLAKA
jgi:two-component system cell cycle sensor histidine kinase/response regulator CckA